MNWESFIVGVVVGALAAILLSLYIFLKAYNKIMNTSLAELKEATKTQVTIYPLKKNKFRETSQLSVEEVE